MKTEITKQKSSSKKKPSRHTFYMVGIGASAGGLEAVTEFLQNLPSDTGMAFIYVQHLSPDYKSILALLLSRSTRMKVQQAKNGMEVLPDNFYVIPPDREMILTDGKIKLLPRKNDGANNLPIDAFFNSLAELHGEEAIGIVLSGSLSDGTQGLKAIKQSGGLTFAQDNSARFDSMPQSAISEGVVDFVLSPKEIARELTVLSKHFVERNPPPQVGKENEIENNDPDLRYILDLLHKKTGVDFNLYKMNTIKRRILRRLLLYDLSSIKQYVKLLKQKDSEIDILYQDLLINVTDFFRDTDSYRYLKTSLFPKLLKKKVHNEALRIWVPACSTGEEAYSIGMMLLDLQRKKNNHITIQIFATDLSEKAIEKARTGEYSAKELESVSPAYLQRFYKKIGHQHYRIDKALREICVFAPHNILRDPPFSRLDFISCRNLLIYFDAEAQRKALATFHYSLNDDGYLILGNSESIGSSQRLFTPVSKTIKVYQRKKNTGAGVFPDLIPQFGRRAVPGENKSSSTPVKNAHPNGLGNIIDSVLFLHYMPASLVINYDMDILQFRGETDFYLTHAPGKASLNILKMIKPEIAFELRNAIQAAMKTKETVRKTDIEMKINNAVQSVNIEVTPLKIDWDEPLLLILFNRHPMHANTHHGKKEKPGSLRQDRKVKKLEEEVAVYRAELRSVVETQEASIEELQSANEEVVSSNEELQTVNEELGTSKEEIQSTNEELATINQELQTRNEQLTEAHNYSEAILSTIHESLLILDKQLRIKTANNIFYEKFRLLPKNTEGHLLYELDESQWDIPDLRMLLENVIIKDSTVSNYEVTHTFKGKGPMTMLLNASRIVQKVKKEELILLAISDVSATVYMQNKQKELEKAVTEKTEELRHANEELHHTNLELEKINKELASFAYVASHDLQEPLRIIRSFANLILQKESEGLSAAGKDYFNRIQDSIKRMQRLIDDLLAYSRTNTHEKNYEKTNLLKILDEVKVLLHHEITEKKAVIKTGNLGELKVIPFQFRQLMQNLLSNALKFSKPDVPPHILIKSEFVKGSEANNEYLLKQKEYCHISFQDNGIGFEPRFKERIFEVFQRLHGKEQYSGTGIGLAIVKKIVDNHQGVVTATGELGKGATFDIYIPVD